MCQKRSVMTASQFMLTLDYNQSKRVCVSIITVMHLMDDHEISDAGY